MGNRLVVVLGIVGIALALASFAGPWWVVGYEGSTHFGPSSGTTTYGPFGIVSVTQARWLSGGNQTNVSDYRYAPATGAVVLTATIAVATGLVLAAVVVLVAAIGSQARRKLTGCFGLAAGAATGVGLLALVVFLPGAVSQDNPGMVQVVPITGFWGSGSWSMFDFSTSLTWGAGWGWYLLLAAAAVFLIAALLRLREKPPAP